MFSKNEKTEEQRPTVVSSAPSLISASLEIDGNLKTDGELQIDGVVHGDVFAGVSARRGGREERGAQLAHVGAGAHGGGRLQCGFGVGLGGWLAAEMAIMCPGQFGKLVLVGAPGIKPPRGEIYDVFLVTARDYIAANYHDAANCAEYQELYGADPMPDQVENWEVAREMASRLSWRPFMHSPSLPYLLRRLRGVPTLLAWGKQDAIVPLSAAEAYQASIPGAELAVFDACGHHPEIEQAGAFVQRVLAFLGDA